MQPVANLEKQEPARVLKLLIVEDEISTVFAMREFFAFTGYQVDCAAGTKDAMGLLDQNRYDVVITDLHFTPSRRAEGMTVLTRVRRGNPDALIVMLTAYGSEESEREAYNGGVNLYETKPVGLVVLAARIEAALNGASPGAPLKADGTRGGACPK
jgi:DNA-binding response OmpR family regulator